MKSGADVNLENSCGLTAMQVARKMGNREGFIVVIQLSVRLTSRVTPASISIYRVTHKGWDFRDDSSEFILFPYIHCFIFIWDYIEGIRLNITLGLSYLKSFRSSLTVSALVGKPVYLVWKPNFARSFSTQLRILKPSKDLSRGSTKFTNQNLMEIDSGVHELWSDIKSNKQKTYFPDKVGFPRSYNNVP